jgi:hypothetical protein
MDVTSVTMRHGRNGWPAHVTCTQPNSQLPHPCVRCHVRECNTRTWWNAADSHWREDLEYASSA